MKPDRPDVTAGIPPVYGNVDLVSNYMHGMAGHGTSRPVQMLLFFVQLLV